jgi:hypothetical protein
MLADVVSERFVNALVQQNPHSPTREQRFFGFFQSLKRHLS